MEPSTPSPTLVRFGNFELDTRAGELSAENGKIRLQEQPLRILMMLIERRGGLVTREELHNALWPGSPFGDVEDGLNHAVRRLRAALGDDVEMPRYIQTVPRRGYRFIAPVVGAGLVSALVQSGPAPKGRPRGAPLRKRRAAIAAAALAFIATALAVGLNVAGLRDRVLRHVGAIHESPLQIQSIAVLPLENLSRDPEQEYFADGMTEALITNLGKIGALRVISRTTAMHYKGTKKTLPEIARELNVDAVVEGSVLRSGNRVRVTANLLHAPTDRHLWANSYESEMQDVLVLQGEVARAIAEEVRIKLTPEEQVRLARGGPVNPEAHLEYLKGRYHWNRFTEAGFRKGIEHFERAIALDAHYAPAYAGVADCYALLAAPVLMSASTRECMLKAEAAARKALELDETLAEAHVSLGRVEWLYDWDWAGAEREFLRAVELNANSPMAHQVYSSFLSSLGRHDESIREAKRALELDPLSLYGYSIMAGAYLTARQYDQAIEQCRRTLELRSDFFYAHFLLAQAYSCKGMREEAIAEAREAVALSEDAPLPKVLLGYTYGVAGRTSEALKVLGEMNEVLRHRQARSLGRALIYTGLGDRNAALAGWEEAYQERASTLVWLRVNPLYDPLRSDARFQDLLRRMNFPP